MFLLRKTATQTMAGLNSSVRLLHTKQSFPVKDVNNQVKAIILETQSDQQPDEPNETYIAKSLIDLAHKTPEDLQNKPLLMFKVNQSVIDSQELREHNKVSPLFQGHALCCLAQITEDKVEIFSDTLVSKVPGSAAPFEEQRSLIETSSYRVKKAEETGSKEYFILIELAKTSLDVETYQQNRQKLLAKNEKYQLFSNACGHAVYEVCTGNSLEEKKVSAQRATHATIQLLIDEQDIFFTNSLDYAIKQSGFAVKADKINENSLKPRHLKSELMP